MSRVSVEKVEVFKYDELDEKTQQKILSQFREWHDEDWEFISDNVKGEFATVCDILGFFIRRGPWFDTDQGGACFDGTYRYEKGSAKNIREEFPWAEELHAIADRLTAIQKRAFYSIYAHITGDDRRGYHTGVEVDNLNDWNCMWSVAFESEIEREIEDCTRDLNHWFVIRLRDEFESRNTEEYILQEIEELEHEFTENGEIYTPRGVVDVV